jgi:hypothetical protein
MSSPIDPEEFMEDASNIPSFSIGEYSSHLKAAILAAPQMKKVSSFFCDGSWGKDIPGATWW